MDADVGKVFYGERKKVKTAHSIYYLCVLVADSPGTERKRGLTPARSVHWRNGHGPVGNSRKTRPLDRRRMGIGSKCPAEHAWISKRRFLYLLCYIYINAHFLCSWFFASSATSLERTRIVHNCFGVHGGWIAPFCYFYFSLDWCNWVQANHPIGRVTVGEAIPGKTISFIS